MAKYKFQDWEVNVLPKDGQFSTSGSGAVVCYDSAYDDGVVLLRINDQTFDQEDLEDFIEFLEGLKEHLKNG